MTRTQQDDYRPVRLSRTLALQTLSLLADLKFKLPLHPYSVFTGLRRLLRVDLPIAVPALSGGKVVVVDNASACGHCAECGRSDPLYCSNFLSLGVNAAGGFAEQVVTRADKVFDASDLPLELAVLAEPLACAIHGVDVDPATVNVPAPAPVTGT